MILIPKETDTRFMRSVFFKRIWRFNRKGQWHDCISTGQDFRVIVVDDHRVMRRMNCSVLQRNNVALIATAENGQASLERQSFQGLDLIISDLNLPEMGRME